MKAKVRYVGEFEQLILLALLRLGSDAYGMRIRREIEDRTQRRISLGAVYTTLERLQAKGLVSSWVGEPTAERGGRAKKFFRIEASGSSALKRSLDASANMAAGLQPVLEGGVR